MIKFYVTSKTINYHGIILHASVALDGHVEHFIDKKGGFAYDSKSN